MSPILSRVLLLLLSILSLSNGRIKPHGNWNRMYPDFNITIDTYFDNIGEKVYTQLRENGLGMTLTQYDTTVNATVYGEMVYGNVSFQNPTVSDFGNVSRSFFAIPVYPSADRSSATVTSGITVANLSLFYDLRAQLTTGDVIGTIDVVLPAVDFTFNLTHTYKTNESTVEASNIYFQEQNHNFQPRTTKIYAIEKLTDTKKGTDVWYGQDLINWQKNVLNPMIVKYAKEEVFPISNT